KILQMIKDSRKTGKGVHKDLAKELFQYVLEVASGRQVKSEEAGFHDWAIFKEGVTL
ncbi:MAG: UxaA family hydrolase, partial [Lachnospiraceae bacterium]|nr:UxaA family hydrolase [Lachnospiraceae bacterium]